MIPKFRAWDKEEKIWLSIRTIGFDDDGSLWYLQAWDDNENDIDPPYLEDDLGVKWELLQSTGLKDKNGVEIFEGDIVKINNSKGLVEFGRYIDDEYIDYGLDGWLVYKEYNGTHVDTPLTEYVLNPNFDVEIINNKYEAPHLLEGDTE